MSLVITCPACGLQGQLPQDGMQGDVQCPQCGMTIPVNPNEAPPLPRLGHADHPLDAFFAAACERTTSPLLPLPLPALPQGTLPEAETQADRDWLREERERLQAYMADQFAALRRQREEFLVWRSQVESTLVTREQELNRLLKHMGGRIAEIERAEAAAASERQALDAVRQSRDRIREQVAVEQGRLAHLRDETDRWHRESRKARMTCAVLEGMARERQAVHETQDRECQHRENSLDRRQAALDRAEEELRLCVAESEELEVHLRQDLERQRREMAREGRELEARRQELILWSGRLGRRFGEAGLEAIAGEGI